MRITCPFCGQRALITSSNCLNDKKTIHDLYCACSNGQCKATFVYSLAHNRNIHPPIKTTLQVALLLINRMNEEEKAELGQTVFR